MSPSSDQARQADGEPPSPMKPSAFMRAHRPEHYSDTADRTTIQLDRPHLEYHLETITARNETHDFEIFCRKLCERTICPNLMPVSGPEGGGDSKADTESIAVSEEIASLTYVGDANHGSESWAFAFSAKKTWTQKVRDDVAGIVATGRGYQRIYCVTSRHARSRDRSRVEDELTKKYGVPVKILDRSWIVEQIVDHERKDLAFHYLRVGREVTSPRLGPSDYSRKQQLEDLEAALGNPEVYESRKHQRAADALIAAKLSRAIERARVETDGRFQRAIRLADAGGFYRQRLMARYEYLWTSFWWFDDIALLNEGYEAFEALAAKSDHAANLEFLCNLMQAVFTSVVHRHLTAEEARLDERTTRLRAILSGMADDKSRPNNALAARTSLIILDVNQAARSGNRKALSSLWPQVSDVLDKAKGLGEFDAESLVKMVEVFGMIAGADPSYAPVVDKLSEFVATRKSDGEGALVLLKRAQQLQVEQHFEIIRLLGRAAAGLTKKEYAPHLIEAMQLLALAYRSAGLLWAARSSMTSALASTFIEVEDDSHIPGHVIGTLGAWCHIALELWHLPDLFEAARLLRGCIAGLPLDEASEKRAKDRYRELDMHLASRIIALPDADLEQMVALPDVLSGLDLEVARTALLYALGFGSTRDVTNDVAWSSNDTDVVTISNADGSKGVAKGVAAGSTTILAQSGAVQGSATLTISNATLSLIQVEPISPSVALGNGLAFTATGTFSDDSTQDITTQVTWESSDEAVATISNGDGSRTAPSPAINTVVVSWESEVKPTTFDVSPWKFLPFKKSRRGVN